MPDLDQDKLDDFCNELTALSQKHQIGLQGALPFALEAGTLDSERSYGLSADDGTLEFV